MVWPKMIPLSGHHCISFYIWLSSWWKESWCKRSLEFWTLVIIYDLLLYKLQRCCLRKISLRFNNIHLLESKMLMADLIGGFRRKYFYREFVFSFILFFCFLFVIYFILFSCFSILCLSFLSFCFSVFCSFFLSFCSSVFLKKM